VSYFYLDPNYVLPSLLLSGISFSISFPVVTIEEGRLEESIIYCFSSLCQPLGSTSKPAPRFPQAYSDQLFVHVICRRLIVTCWIQSAALCDVCR